MTRALLKGSLLLLPGAVLLALAYLFLARAAIMPPAIVGLADYAPYALAAIGAAIGWRFNHSNAVIAFLLIVIGHGALTELPAQSAGRAVDPGTVRAALAIFLPLNLLYLSWLKDRGVVTAQGRLRLAVILIQLAGLAFVMWQAPRELAGLLATKLIPAMLPRFAGMPDIGTIAFLVALAAFFVRLLLRLTPRDAGYFGATVAVVLAFGGGRLGGAVMFAAASAILAVAVIQESYRSAFVDELTALPARRALQALLMRLGDRYAIAMVDIDHFKKFNDTYGHDVGDHVLRFVGAMLEGVGGGGKPFRYGGEEFTVVFPGRTVSEVLPHLEALRRSIAGRPFRLRARDKSRIKRWSAGIGRKVAVTVSAGVAERAGDQTPDDVIKEADRALYRAKAKGRNQVSI